MKPAFAESATINGSPIQVLFDDVTKADPTDSTGRIDILQVIGNIAVVRVILTTVSLTRRERAGQAISVREINTP